jgi:hypothetical protein
MGEFGGSVKPMPEDIVQQAKKEFPYLGGQDFDYRINYQPNRNGLESYPIGETQRPDWSKQDRFGMEIFHPDLRTVDVLGDYVSHHAIDHDPVIKDYYKRFTNSISKDQWKQIDRMQKNEGDTRDPEVYRKVSGIPSAFRGYAFKQLDDNDFKYTDDQKKMFDEMMGYLKKPRTATNAIKEAMVKYGIE